MNYLNMSDPSDRLQLQKEIEKPSTGKGVKTVEVYPNMTPKILEPRMELPPEAILVAVGDCHPMEHSTTPKTSKPKRSTGGKMGKEWG